MRISVLATDVYASDRMKHVDATAMQTAARTRGPRQCLKIPGPRTIQSAAARKSEAKRLRHRLVVHGLVVTRRAMRPPLLQHIAAHATSRAPRRVAAT